MLFFEEPFFNSYQGTTPPEDIADSIVFFVITSSAVVEEHSEMRFKKLKCFYQFEELVNFRTATLENIYDLSGKRSGVLMDS